MNALHLSPETFPHKDITPRRSRLPRGFSRSKIRPVLYLTKRERIQHEAGPRRGFTGVQLVAQFDEAFAELFGAGRHLGSRADGHIGKALDDLVDVHTPYEAADAVEVARAAALELEVPDGAGLLIDIYHEHLGADALGIENMLHGESPVGEEGCRIFVG